MDTLTWTAMFLATSCFWMWLIFWGGAQWLENSFLSGVLLFSNAPRWSASGIRLFAAGYWICKTVWFVIGLVTPAARVVLP